MAGCTDATHQPKLSETIAAQYRSGKTVDLTQLNTAWDRAFIFGPYTSHKQVNTAIGTHWKAYDQSKIGYDEAICLVILMHGGEVNSWFTHPRASGDLTQHANDTGYMRSEAIFSLQ